MTRTSPPPDHPDSDAIRRAARALREGRLVAFPTETVYGLGANALDAAAVKRIYEAKGRPPTSPLIVHVASIEAARALVARWPDRAQQLAARYWPGPLTLVLPKIPEIPDIVTAGLATVGLRVPDHPVALALLIEAGVPVAAPSANRFTEVSPTEAGHLPDDLRRAAACVLDGGAAPVGIESTVLSLAGDAPVLLRPGMISRDAIEALIGPVVTAGSVEGAHPSPGMHHRHYAPSTRLLLVRGGAVPGQGRGAYVQRKTAATAARVVLMPETPEAYAARLYAVLHELDAEGWDWIAIEEPPARDEWSAIRDRLDRAAGRGTPG